MAGWGGAAVAAKDPANSSWFDTFMSDTVGVLYQAGTGKVDPWTQNQIDSQGAQDIASASNGTISYDDALASVQQQSQQLAANPSMPTWLDGAKAWWSAAWNDDGSGCSLITNPAGCYPSWLPYAALGLGAILLLWVLRPYVVAAEE